MAESEGHFEHPFIAVQLQDVAGAVDYGGAALAAADVFLHGHAQIGFNFAVEIV
jgi:hypothetical protein